MRNARFLFEAPYPNKATAPWGTFRYASLRFARIHLPDDLRELVLRLAEGLNDPRVTYRRVELRKGEAIGNLAWHCDGQQKPEEIHRLLCFGEEGTLGAGGEFLEAGKAWEYDGSYSHRPVPSRSKEGERVLLRVSQTKMLFRNFWEI